MSVDKALQDRRLLTVADHIEKVPQRYFDMECFRRKYGRTPPWDTDPFNYKSCGAVGCALGHVPELGGEFAPLPEEDWGAYALRVLGIHPLHSADTDDSRAWCWMFSAHWADTDNTPQGAADRIRWFVKHGAPGDWEAQIYGDAPLCYLEARRGNREGD